MLVRSGAWKSLYELESLLTLEEMFLLYRASTNEVALAMKISAAAQGADVDLDEDWYSPEPEEAMGAYEIRSMPFGLGYSVAESN